MIFTGYIAQPTVSKHWRTKQSVEIWKISLLKIGSGRDNGKKIVILKYGLQHCRTTTTLSVVFMVRIRDRVVFVLGLGAYLVFSFLEMVS